MNGLMLDTRGSKNVSLDDLRTIPTPEVLGSRHRPIPHAELVDSLVDGITGRGWRVANMNLGIAAHGASVFGTMDLRRNGFTIGDPGDEMPQPLGEMGTLFGFRSSTNSTTSIRAVAGKRVFVCSNMMLSGDMFVLRRKSTTGINLREVIEEGLDKFLIQSDALDRDVDRLRNTAITDTDAKARIFDMFNAEVLPSRLLKPVATNYFHPNESFTDCQPRSLLGLNNAATRSIQGLKPEAQLDAAQNIGRHFQLAA